MELGVSHVQNLSSLPPVIDNIFDKYNKNLVPIRSLSDHDTNISIHSKTNLNILLPFKWTAISKVYQKNLSLLLWVPSAMKIDTINALMLCCSLVVVKFKSLY